MASGTDIEMTSTNSTTTRNATAAAAGHNGESANAGKEEEDEIKKKTASATDTIALRKSSWIAAASSHVAACFLSIFKRVFVSLLYAKCFILCDCCGMPEEDETEDDSTEKHPASADGVSETNDNTRRSSSRSITNVNMKDLLRSHLLTSSEKEANTVVGQHGIANDQLVLVYSLELNAFNKSKLFRCAKYNRVRFHLAPSLYGRSVNLLTNYSDDYTQFQR